MYNFKIVTIGKLTEKYLKDGESEYLKRLKISSNIKFEEIVVSHSSKLSEDEIKKIESNELIEHGGKGFLVALTEHGKTLDSQGFSKFIESTFVNRSGEIVFLIAGALGWDKEIINRADYKLSLSPLTFPHHVARFILVEQIYRAVTIMNNHPYHK